MFLNIILYFCLLCVFLQRRVNLSSYKASYFKCIPLLGLDVETNYSCFDCVTDQKATTKRKIQPVIWDKGSESGTSASGRGAKTKRGDPPRRGKYLQYAYIQ